MDQQIEELKSGIDRLRSSEQMAHVAALDSRLGRVVGVFKSLGWIAAAAIGAAVGFVFFQYGSGLADGVATVVIAIFVTFALWRAYRNIWFAARASDALVDELEQRARHAGFVWKLARSFRYAAQKEAD